MYGYVPQLIVLCKMNGFKVLERKFAFRLKGRISKMWYEDLGLSVWPILGQSNYMCVAYYTFEKIE